MTTVADIAVPRVKRGGAALTEEQLENLLSVRVDRQLGVVGRATLRFRDVGFTLSGGDLFAPGTKVSVEVKEAGVLLDGVVTGIGLEYARRSVPELVVTVDDAGFKLARGTHVDTYLNSTYADVIKKMAGRHGLTAEVDSTTLRFEYLMQAGTDLDFLNSIVERIGFVWWIEGEKTLKVSKVEAGSPALQLILGASLSEFAVRASGLRPTKLVVSGWDANRQQNVNGKNASQQTTASDPHFVAKYRSDKPAGTLADAPASLADRPVLTPGEADAMASALYTDWASAAVTARGTCGVNAKLVPGATVKVTDAGPASGDYLVSHVEHVYDRHGFVSRFTAGPLRASGLVDTLGSRPPDPGFHVPGLVVAVVTDNSDPDNQGRVKVKYTGVDGEIESPWARVVTLGAGADRGVVFHPEVKDEVLVGFERGDTRRPVVIGGLFSEKNTLPTANKIVARGKTSHRRITSRKGHVIEFADGEAPGEQHLLIQLGTAQHKLRVGADRFDIEMAAGKPISIKAGNSLFEITASGDISMEANNVTIKARQNLTMEANTKAALKGTAQVEVQGGVATFKASGVGNVQAGGPLALKGATVAIN